MLMWLVVALSLFGTILNIKKNRCGFACWIVSNAIWCIYNIYIREYPQATLFFVYFGLSIWGWHRWKK